MATSGFVTRTNGDAAGLVYVDTATHGAGIGAPVVVGLSRRPTFVKVVANVDLRGETVTGGAVEAILRFFALTASVDAYQVENDASGQVSIILEGIDGAFDHAAEQTAQTALQQLGSVGVGPVSLAGATVSSAEGFKLA